MSIVMKIVKLVGDYNALTKRRIFVFAILLTLLFGVVLVYFSIDKSIRLVSSPDAYFVVPFNDQVSPSPIGGQLQTI